MATHNGKPARPVWAPTRPAPGAAHPHPAPLPAKRTPAPAAPPSWAATRPAEDWQPNPQRPSFQPTRPAEGWAPTRPAEGWAPTRPLAFGAATRPMEFGAPTRPMAYGSPARPAAAGAAATAAAPIKARPAVKPPDASVHWQLAGLPGENLVLMPGQMHLGQQVASLRTLLGSCVAITLWHPTRRIGGMCHFLLPHRQRRPGDAPDGRYGDEAVEAMVATLKALRTQPEEYVAHLYGGADTMSGVSAAKFNIGERNIEQGWSLIDKYGFQLDGVDVGEDIPRVVSLAMDTGMVTMRRGSGHAPDHLRG